MLLGILFASVPALAQSAADPPTGIWERGNLLGDIGGLRPVLDRYGVSFGLTEIDEVFGNATGGRKRGAVYEGLTEMSLGADLGKAIGLPGGIVNISAFQIHGRGLASNNIDSLNDISAIEADRATRLDELWYQQSFMKGAVDVRVGQLAAEREFAISDYAGLFMGAGFGWPTLGSIDLPAGGPAYPLATPAIRLRARPDKQTTLLLGVFNGNPSPGLSDDPQMRNPTGANLRFQGVMVIAEAQFARNEGDGTSGLPGTYKLGGWYDTVGGIDPFFATGGELGAESLPLMGDTWGLYAIVDQTLWQPAGARDDAGLGVFLRAIGAPPDRNQVVVSMIAGLRYKGLPGRSKDSIGFGVDYARIGGAAIAGDRVRAAASGGALPVRSAETIFELTYFAQVTPWWVLQPDFQYVVRPGGGIPNPDGSGRIIGNAAIFGLHSVVTF